MLVWKKRCEVKNDRCKRANWKLGLQNALHFSVSRGVIQMKERGPAKWQLAAYNRVHNKRMADGDRPTSTVNPQQYLQTWCKCLNSELGAQTALHLSVSKGVIQRKRESQSSATSSSNDNSRPGPMAQAVHTGMKYVLFT